MPPDSHYPRYEDEETAVEREHNDVEAYSMRLLGPQEDGAENSLAQHRPSYTHRFQVKLGTLIRWWSGPQPPHQHRISPISERVQRTPLELLDKCAPTKFAKKLAFGILCFVWLAAFNFYVGYDASPLAIPGYGPVLRLTCISRPWPNDGKDCGLDGRKCQPFDDASFAFWCPPDCHNVKVWEDYKVGKESALYRPLVIGGPDQLGYNAYYRGDSFICGSAIHSGIIRSGAGGYGILNLAGEKSEYHSTKRNRIESIGFNSSFPMSYIMEPVNEEGPRYVHMRWGLLAVCAVFTTLISLFTTSPAVFFFSTFTIIFFEVALASDMPDSDEYIDLVELSFSRFLPALLISLLLYLYIIKRTLQGLTAQVEKTILWLGGCWLGALDNYTFDTLPIRRLTFKDISQQPGGVITFLFLIAAVIPAIISQIRALRMEGRLLYYLRWYGILAGMLFCLTFLTQLNIRIHHYILALILLPGTSMQTRPSLIFQGLLVGLFINGVARWGFASILETDATLEGFSGGGLLPNISAPIIDGSVISFAWDDLMQEWNGVSVRVNDVERFRWFKDDGPPEFKYTRDKNETLYFRFSYLRRGFVDGFKVGSYSEPGIWELDGTWIDGND